MSGEVQPKRRNKKRKKANLEALQQQEYQEEKAAAGMLLGDEKEEIEEDFELKDHSSGATGWCAKILFFVLLSVLLLMVGLICMEHTGSKSVEPPAESRFAPMFEGLVDDTPVEHEETPIEEEEDEGFSEDLQDFYEEPGIEEPEGPEIVPEDPEIVPEESGSHYTEVHEPEPEVEHRTVVEEVPEGEEPPKKPLVYVDEDAPISEETSQESMSPLEDTIVHEEESTVEELEPPKGEEDEGVGSEEIHPSETLKEDEPSVSEPSFVEEKDEADGDFEVVPDSAVKEPIHEEAGGDFEVVPDSAVEEPVHEEADDDFEVVPDSAVEEAVHEEQVEDAVQKEQVEERERRSVEEDPFSQDMGDDVDAAAVSQEELDDSKFDSANYEETPKDLEMSHTLFSEVINLAHRIQALGRPDLKDLLESRRGEIDEMMRLISKGSLEGVLPKLTELQEYLSGLLNDKSGDNCEENEEEEHEKHEAATEEDEGHPVPGEAEDEAEEVEKVSREAVSTEEGQEEESHQHGREEELHQHSDEGDDHHLDLGEIQQEPIVEEVREKPVDAKPPAEEQSSTISKETEESTSATEEGTSPAEEVHHYEDTHHHEEVHQDPEPAASEPAEPSEEEEEESAGEEVEEQRSSPIIQHPPRESPISSDDAKIEGWGEEEEEEVKPVKGLKPPPSPAREEESEELASEDEEEEEEEEEDEVPVVVPSPQSRVPETPKQNGPADDSGAEEESEGNEADAEDDDIDNFWNDGGAQEAPIEEEQPPYKNADITNQDDAVIAEQLDQADEFLEEAKTAAELMLAKTRFEKLEDKQRPKRSPRALYGRALALDKLSSEEKSNTRLEQSIEAYKAVLDLEELVPMKLYKMAAMKIKDRASFRGWVNKAVRAMQRLIMRNEEDIDARNELAVSFLLLNQIDAAKEVLQTTLKKWPHSGFAKAHLGFILKTSEKNMKDGAKYLLEGIETKENVVKDGRFYYHCGDALYRLGRRDEADNVYREAVELGLFLNFYQRSLYNVDRLTGRPWWTKEQTTYQKQFQHLEKNWKVIRDEFLSLLEEDRKIMRDEAENLREKGTWQQFELYSRGRQHPYNCGKAKKTCSLLSSFKEATGCTRGQIKFSIMDANTHVFPHAGPTNCRIRAHLGLLVPSGVAIKVANDTKKWREGEFLILDDSFVHEVWNNSTSMRAILIVDVWHPELTTQERKTLSPI